MKESTVVDNVLSTLLDKAIDISIRLIIAVVIVIVSFKVVNILARKIEKRGENGRFDKTIARTFAYVFNLGFKALIIISLVAFLGIDISGFAALIVSLGAGIGLALNGALSNLAGGILLILTRPFRVDDFIEAQGYSGTVEDVHITTTKIRTPDNKVVYIPNGPLSSDTIVNYSVKDIRRIDFVFPIGYREDFRRVKSIILSVLLLHTLIIDDPEPTVRVSEYTDSSVSLTARAWVKSEDFWNVRFDILENVKLAFDREEIEFPFNQLVCLVFGDFFFFHISNFLLKNFS